MDHFGKDQDKEIVELLGRLRDTGPEYPPRLYSARRAAVIAALAALPLGGAAAASLFGKLSSALKGMSVIDKAILAVEVAAITGVTGFGAATAYVYRDEIKQFILSAIPTQTSSGFPTLSPATEPPAGATVEATPSVSPTPTGTLLFVATSGPGTGGSDITEPPATQPPATPPPPKPTATRGLHLGQTKTPKP